MINVGLPEETYKNLFEHTDVIRRSLVDKYSPDEIINHISVLATPRSEQPTSETTLSQATAQTSSESLAQKLKDEMKKMEPQMDAIRIAVCNDFKKIANREDREKVFKQLCRQLHPDKNSNTNITAEFQYLQSQKDNLLS